MSDKLDDLNKIRKDNDASSSFNDKVVDISSKENHLITGANEQSERLDEVDIDENVMSDEFEEGTIDEPLFENHDDLFTDKVVSEEVEHIKDDNSEEGSRMSRRDQRKPKKKKSSLLSNIILIIGIIGMLVGGYILGTTLWGEFQRGKQTKSFLDDAYSAISPENYITREEFNPQNGDRVGILEIPSQKMVVPIVEGTGEENLHASAGHYDTTHWPGDGKQIFLTGHRNTEFGVLKHVQIGDEIVMKMQYGEFKYRIVAAPGTNNEPGKVVHETDVHVVDGVTEFPNDQLVLMTCYPFTFGADTVDRYLVYAERVIE